MKIAITMNLDEGYADPDHSTGVTVEGYNKINDALAELGTDIEVERAS
jgi:hypothetical protein